MASWRCLIVAMQVFPRLLGQERPAETEASGLPDLAYGASSDQDVDGENMSLVRLARRSNPGRNWEGPLMELKRCLR